MVDLEDPSVAQQSIIARTRAPIPNFEKACRDSDGLTTFDLIDREVLGRKDGGRRFWTLTGRIESFGYEVTAAPLIGCYDVFCDGLRDCFDVLEQAIVIIRRDWNVRGYSRNAMAHLHKSLPQVGWHRIPDDRAAELEVDEIDRQRGWRWEQEIRRHLNLPQQD